jgi:hypothetical protein
MPWRPGGGRGPRLGASLAHGLDRPKIERIIDQAAPAANPEFGLQEFQHEYDERQVGDRLLQQQDYQQGIKDAEKRVGMRAALRNFRRSCAGSHETAQ